MVWWMVWLRLCVRRVEFFLVVQTAVSCVNKFIKKLNRLNDMVIIVLSDTDRFILSGEGAG